MKRSTKRQRPGGGLQITLVNKTTGEKSSFGVSRKARENLETVRRRTGETAEVALTRLITEAVKAEKKK